ncbi:unnamed protein product [Schistosoma mattheei]|nr:unnamed protein product [Schistosoma mattheei]
MGIAFRSIRDFDRRITTLEDEIRNSKLNRIENIDQYISCRTNYWTGDAAMYALYRKRNYSSFYPGQLANNQSYNVVT